MQKRVKLLFLSAFVFLTTCLLSKVDAQVMNWHERHRGSLYLSGGLGIQNHQASTIHLNQNTSNPKIDLLNVAALDNNANNSSFSVNKLMYTLGYFFNYKQNLAIEISYEPLSYYVTDLQNIHTKIGTKDTNIVFSQKNGNYFYYNNKSKLIQLNLVKRKGIFRTIDHKIAMDVIGKVGGGPVLLTAQNSILGNANVPVAQNNCGFNADASLGLQLTYKMHLYLELAAKYDFVSLNNINVYKGTASQNYTTTCIILNLGYKFSITRYNPMFRKGEKKRPKGVPNGPEPRGDIKKEEKPNFGYDVW